jgi:phospholipid/cholesterol/gamma-HCH transport system substrate-binding protein
MESERKLELRAGVFTLVALLAVGAVVFTMSRGGGLFAPRYTLLAEFDDIEGLLVNDPVHLAGHSVGRVSDVEFLEPGGRKAVRVSLDLDTRVQERIRSDSLASLHMRNLLGDMYVSVSLGSGGGRTLADGEMLPSVDPTSFLALADQAAELVDNLVSISDSARSIVGEFDESMGTRTVAETLGSLRRITERVEAGDGLLHALIFEPEGTRSLRELDAAAADLRRILREVETGDGVLHELVYGDAESSPLGRVDAAAVRLESVLEKVDRGDGTLGLLVNDPSLYEETRLLVRGAGESRLLRALIDYVRPENGEPE